LLDEALPTKRDRSPSRLMVIVLLPASAILLCMAATILYVVMFIWDFSAAIPPPKAKTATPMVRVSVNSSTLRSVGYAAVTRTLEVELSDGEVYQYLDVSPVIHRELMTNPSPGSYFDANIKRQYRSKRM
jgi:hypothetical protein